MKLRVLRRLRNRVMLAVCAVVLLLQGGAFWMIAAANRDNARDHARQDLVAAEAAVLRGVDERRLALRAAAIGIAGDPLLQEPADGLPLGDRLAARVADLPARYALLLGEAGMRAAAEIDADGARPVAAPWLQRFASTSPAPAQAGGASVALVQGRAFDVVRVPLARASGERGWLLLAAEFDAAFADRLAAPLALRLGFEVRNDAGTLALGETPPPHARDAWRSASAGDIVLRVVPVAGVGEAQLVAVLQRPLQPLLAVFGRLHGLLAVLAVASVALALLAGAMLARGIARPLLRLARSAERLGEGDYREPIRAEGDDELGALAESLEGTRRALAEREQRILQLAYEDALTGLPNRTRLIETLRVALRDAQRDGRRCAVMLLDLNRFKQINDTLGHAAGDAVLRRVGTLLAAAVRPADTVARLGGDEYAVALPGADADAARAVARAIVGALKTPIGLDGQDIDVLAAIGIAVYPDHGGDVDTLLRCADIAMYAAKRNYAAFALYDPSHEVARREHLSLLGELRRAVAESQLRAYYQPKVSLSDGRPAGAEALVRWSHPQRGLLAPAVFLPYAEHTGFVRVITRWMLAVTLRQCGIWAARGTPLPVAVNVTAADLMGSDLARMVEDLLRTHAVPPALVCLEITESSFMQDPDRALQAIGALNALGVRLAIDDFGTGFSSLAYLKRLRVHEIKIDQTFVRGVAAGGKDARIVRSTIELAHSLGLKVTAEGVEDRATEAALQRIGCDVAQGWYFGRPMRRSQLEVWLQRRAEAQRRGARTRVRGERARAAPAAAAVAEDAAAVAEDVAAGGAPGD